MGELSGRAGDWLGWRRTIDFPRSGVRPWGRGLCGAPEAGRRSQTLGGLELGWERGRGSPSQKLAETWSLRHRGDREQRACGDSWGRGGCGEGACARVRRRALGLWGSWGPLWVPGKDLRAASEQLHWKLAGKTLPRRGLGTNQGAVHGPEALHGRTSRQ